MWLTGLYFQEGTSLVSYQNIHIILNFIGREKAVDGYIKNLYTIKYFELDILWDVCLRQSSLPYGNTNLLRCVSLFILVPACINKIRN